MTNSHAQFPPSQIRRTAQLQPMSAAVAVAVAAAAHPYQQIQQQQHQRHFSLSQFATNDPPTASQLQQRSLSAAPSRNGSSTSLAAMGRGLSSFGKDRERDYWLPEYLHLTHYGRMVSQYRQLLQRTQPSLQHGGSNSTSPATASTTPMRRELSGATPHTVPSSRNPSPHNQNYNVTARGVAFEVAEKSAPQSTNATATSSSSTEPPLLPSKLNDRDRCTILEILNDGMEVHFSAPSKGTESDAASVRADRPIPPQCGVYYYEVSVLARGNKGCVLCAEVTDVRYIGIGFCRSNVTLDRLPGWEPESWGYHGDDGHSFCCQGTGKAYGPTFTTGDVVGCCINFSKGTAFYTKNGVELDIAFRDLTFDLPNKPGKGNFYPCIGLRTQGEQVRVNFGQKPFVFDIVGYVMVSPSLRSCNN
jgi:SPRY domain